MITIIDYGLGNLRSVQKSFERANIDVKISRDISDIKAAEKLVLPGVGHFGKGMENLKKFDLIDVLNEKVLEQKTPVLGICLGMQLMTSYSEESDNEGLNWVDAKTLRFHKDEAKKYRVPHIGWNTANLERSESKIMKGIEDSSQYYFVHSYYVNCANEQDVLTKSSYGINFVSSFQKDNIVGVQFHPEKSFSAGLTLLSNFSNI